MNETACTEARLMAFLEDPASYPHRPASVRLVQTHASFVAIASPYVYKVKKPVDFGFLDFSTLEKRKHYCEQEVVLNRRLCASIYEGVIPIRSQGDRLMFEGESAIIEYAVLMRELAPDGFLERLLDRGQAGRPEIDRIVEKLVPFYRGQHPTPDITQWGEVDKLRISTDENFAQTKAFVGEVLPRTSFEAIRHFTESFYRHRRTLLERRRDGGRIRDCHGDLHAEHVHLSARDVCIYDCIEFNERLRYIDVASDIAFLAMDLHFHGRPVLSRYLVRRAAERLGDDELPALIPFYACYRAYVRGKVELLRSTEAEVAAREQEASRERARRYFQLALDYAVTGGEPMALVVMGQVGTGKSTVASALGTVLGWEVAASDHVRKTLAGVSLYERGAPQDRARLYAEEHTRQTYATLHERARANAQAGRCTLLDATYGKPAHREALRGVLREARLPHLFVELSAPEDMLRERLRRREGAANVLSDARLEDFDLLCARYVAPTPKEDPDLLTVSTEADLDHTIGSILEAMVQRALVLANDSIDRDASL